MGPAVIMVVCFTVVVTSWNGDQSDRSLERSLLNEELHHESRLFHEHQRHRAHYNWRHRYTSRRHQSFAAKNIVQIAAATPDLSTLVTAVTDAGLVDTLSGAGPFTVFAPTNEAFAKLPREVLDHLLEPRNKKELQAVLEYHVLSGAVESRQLKPFQEVKTLEGQTLDIRVRDGRVYVGNGGARVTTADVIASNGVVHIIDRVLIPPHTRGWLIHSSPPSGQALPTRPRFALPQYAPVARPHMRHAHDYLSPHRAAKNIVQIAAATPDLSTLVTAVQAAGLVDTLSGAGPFTVFAPTNEAFAMLPPGTLNHLLLPRNKKELVAVLTYHVVSGAIRSTDLKPEQSVKTVEGQKLEIRVRDGKVYVGMGGAQVTTANVIASNGVVHIIDRVLIPPQATL